MSYIFLVLDCRQATNPKATKMDYFEIYFMYIFVFTSKEIMLHNRTPVGP